MYIKRSWQTTKQPRTQDLPPDPFDRWKALGTRLTKKHLKIAMFPRILGNIVAETKFAFQKWRCFLTHSETHQMSIFVVEIVS
jgi:hypothetical protein